MSIVNTEEKTLVRDTNNMALLETNLNVKNDYLVKRKMLNENRQMKSDMEEMKKTIEILMQRIK